MSIPTESIATVLGSGLAGIAGLLKAFQLVQEGERGIKLTFGRARHAEGQPPKVIEPGFVLLVPFVQRIAKHHVRQQSYRFPEQHITLCDGLIYRVGGMVIFKVVDVYKALFEIDSIDHSIDDLCMAAIRDELQQIGHEELRDLDAISAKLLARVKERASQWGIEIMQFSLPECAPTPETANLINAALGVKLRLKALDIGLKEHGLSIEKVSPNFAAVLVGIPLAATLGSDRGSKDSDYHPAANTAEEEEQKNSVSISLSDH